MAKVWGVVLVHRNTDGSYDTQVITPRVVGRSPRELQVSLRLEERTEYNFRSGMEVWMGFWDNQGGYWVDDEYLWGGYIWGRIQRRKVGGMLRYTLPLLDYNILLEKTFLRGFPMDPIWKNPHDQVGLDKRRKYHIPPHFPEADAIAGYSDGYNAKQWLVGSPDYPSDGTDAYGLHEGILRAALQDVDLTGIPLRFTFPTFHLDARPSNTGILGHMEMMNLRGMVEMVLACATLVDPSLKPYYTMRAVADGTRVRPKFVLVDLNDAASADWVFTDDPAQPRDSSRFWDYVETFNAENVRTRTEVFGLGSSRYSQEGITIGDPTYARVWARSTRNIDNFPPTYYQREAGWVGEPLHDDRVTDTERAVQLSQMVDDAVNTEQFTATFRTLDPVRQGDVVSLSIRSTNMEALLPVTDVDWEEENGQRVFVVTAGTPEQTIQAVLGGQAAYVSLLGQQGIRRARRGEDGNFVDPTLPRLTPVERWSDSKFQGQRQSRSDKIVGDWRRGAMNRTKMSEHGQAITPDIWNFIEASIGEPLTNRPEAGVDQLAAPQYVGGLGEIEEFDDYQGRNGPQHHVFEFRYDDYISLLLPDRAMITTAQVKFLDDDVTGARLASATFDANGENIVTPAGDGVVNVSLKRYDPDPLVLEYVEVTPDVSPQQPLIVSFKEDLQLHVTGIPDGQRAYVLVSERRPDPRFFNYP